MTRPIEDLQAGAAFRDSMIPRADADKAGAPLWHGWVIMDAFLAGVDHALAALPPAGWRDISTAPKDGRQIVVRYKNKDGEDRYTTVRWKEGEWRIGSFNGGKQIFVLAHQYQPNAWCELILPAALPPAPQRTGEREQ